MSFELKGIHGPRSTKKLGPLHGWVQEQLRESLGEELSYIGKTKVSVAEKSIEGMYYDKNVDVAVMDKENVLGIVNIKFIMSNYKQNANNYLEQQIGETANLRRQNIVYGNIMCLTYPTPYYDKNKELKRLEKFNGHDFEKYIKLRKDHMHIHAPHEMAIFIIKLSEDLKRVEGRMPVDEIEDMTDAQKEHLDREFSIDHFIEAMALRIKLRQISP